jgi:hypothetical protein
MSGVEFRQEPGGVAVGSEELHDGLEVEDLILTVDGVALRASVLEEFLALGGSDEGHVFDSCVGRTPAVRSPRTRTAPGPRGVEHKLIEAGAAEIEKAADVTAALRWRGGCVQKAHFIVVASQTTHGQLRKFSPVECLPQSRRPQAQARDCCQPR